MAVDYDLLTTVLKLMAEQQEGPLSTQAILAAYKEVLEKNQGTVTIGKRPKHIRVEVI